MKAAARRSRGILASIGLMIGLSAGSGSANGLDHEASLPSGLPKLPGFGETMMRDMRSGIALAGFDAVAYYLGGGAVPGLPEHELTHDGAVWRFATAANRGAFLDAPAVYEPRFAGFDASAVAEGRAVDADPRRFVVIGQELFFFRTEENRRRFVAEAPLRARALANWPTVAQLVAR